jgi:hypothetical protein
MCHQNTVSRFNLWYDWHSKLLYIKRVLATCNGLYLTSSISSASCQLCLCYFFKKSHSFNLDQVILMWDISFTLMWDISFTAIFCFVIGLMNLWFCTVFFFTLGLYLILSIFYQSENPLYAIGLNYNPSPARMSYTHHILV